jgi:hypothetical protein
MDPDPELGKQVARMSAAIDREMAEAAAEATRRRDADMEAFASIAAASRARAEREAEAEAREKRMIALAERQVTINVWLARLAVAALVVSIAALIVALR